ATDNRCSSPSTSGRTTTSALTPTTSSTGCARGRCLAMALGRRSRSLPSNDGSTKANRNDRLGEPGPSYIGEFGEGPGCPLDGRRPSLGSVVTVQGSLGLEDELIGEQDDPVTERLGVDESHGFLVAGVAEEACAGSKHDRKDLQPQLVDEVVID